MMEKLKAYQEKIDALSIRERAMVLLAIVAVLVFLWDSFLMNPLDIRQRQLQSQLQAERAQLSGLNIQMRQAIAAQKIDPNAANRERLAELQSALSELEENVRDTATDLIEPARMPQVLRSVINQISGLTLRQLNGLGVSSLMEKTKPDAEAEESAGTQVDNSSSMANAYKHGMRMELRGDYLTTLEYLRRLQALEWNFFWDSLEFQIGEYPDADTTLTIYTLSLTSDWIRA